MNWSTAEIENSDLRILSDSELDEANGGFLWLIFAAAYVFGVGAVAGYYATSAIIHRH